MSKESICRKCFHSYVCEQFNENRNAENQRCLFYNDHFVHSEDVVEVVRCKDCKHCKKDNHLKELYCLKMSGDEHTHWVDKDFYCGYGERREQ